MRRGCYRPQVELRNPAKFYLPISVDQPVFDGTRCQPLGDPREVAQIRTRAINTGLRVDEYLPKMLDHGRAHAPHEQQLL